MYLFLKYFYFNGSQWIFLNVIQKSNTIPFLCTLKCTINTIIYVYIFLYIIKCKYSFLYLSRSSITYWNWKYLNNKNISFKSWKIFSLNELLDVKVNIEITSTVFNTHLIFLYHNDIIHFFYNYFMCTEMVSLHKIVLFRYRRNLKRITCQIMCSAITSLMECFN